MKVEVNRSDLALLLIALRGEADGRELRRDLVRGLRVAVQPAAAAARAAILAMPVHGRHQPDPPLRVAVAAGVKVQVRTGRRAGVAVVARKRGMPRGFRNAPKRLNAPSWRHPLFGDWEEPQEQVGMPGWFDETLRAARPETELAARAALERVAQRISERTRG